MADEAQRVVDLFGGAVSLVPGGITVRDPSKLRSPATDRLVWQAVFGGADEREAARWLLWELGQITGARPASINAPIPVPQPDARRFGEPASPRARIASRIRPTAVWRLFRQPD